MQESACDQGRVWLILLPRFWKSQRFPFHPKCKDNHCFVLPKARGVLTNRSIHEPIFHSERSDGAASSHGVPANFCIYTRLNRNCTIWRAIRGRPATSLKVPRQRRRRWPHNWMLSMAVSRTKALPAKTALLQANCKNWLRSVTWDCRSQPATTQQLREAIPRTGLPSLTKPSALSLLSLMGNLIKRSRSCGP